ncbi:MAG: B12-binding domain-containing radical SAM protein [Clostridiales bacterium]|nr:B12-binding domain-containing radical SAM protein [Clostridiales bacterium]
MKILLAACNAKYIHSNPAIYSLRAFAGGYGKDIFLREYTINQQKDLIRRDIYRLAPEVVCFSCYIWNISFIRDLARDLAMILPGTRFWAGGPEVSFDPEEFLEANPEFTGVLVGEGEETFRELAAYYIEGRGTLREIDGIVFRRKGEEGCCRTSPRSLTDLNRIPFIYQDLSVFRNRILYYESSRGCPFACSYCLSSVDKSLRFRDTELVKKELAFFLEHRVPQVKFVDRTFNCSHAHAMEIWRYLAENDNGVTNFHFEISADLLREEEMEVMRTMRPGLIQLEIGVQSTNPDTLAAIRRSADFRRLSENVRKIHSFRNIHQHLDLIAGLPFEDYESFHRSFCDVYALRPQQLQLGFLKVLKGSPMAEKAGEYEIRFMSREPYEVLSTRWLSYGDVIRLKLVEEMVEVYYNSGQFVHTVEYMERFFPDSFAFYECLGEFYDRKGYLDISHSRMRRYEILLEFWEEHGKSCGRAGELKDCMTLDLCLRESPKSRPRFARDQKPFEKAVWEYRRTRKIARTAHVEVFHSGRAILFDYEIRDYLTGNARTEDLTDCLGKIPGYPGDL